MNNKRQTKKGFTIVELVIVVAVIAILSAVLIPTFSSVVNKANYSADVQAVRQMNTALSATADKPDDIIEAADILSDAGYNTEKGLTPVYKGYSFYWYKPTNQIVYVNENNGQFKLEYPSGIQGFPTEKTLDCQPLAAGIAAVIAPPTVSGETTVGVANNTTTVEIPETVTDFESLVEWIDNDGCKTEKMKTTINNSQTLGIALAGGDIKLNADMVVDPNNGDTMRFHILEDTTIDLNGYTIRQQCGANAMSGYALFSVHDGATLNIIDSSAAKTGAIEAPILALQANSGAVINMYGGTIRTTEERTAADDYTYLVGVYGGTFNMYGGTIDTTCEAEHVTDEYKTALSTWSMSTSVCNLYSGKIIGVVEYYAGLINNYGVTIEGTILS